MNRIFVAVAMCAAALVFAQDGQARAKAELDAQLKAMTGNRPTKVKVEFVPLDELNYELKDATFELDGTAVRTPLLKSLMGEASVLVFSGDVSPGKHRVKADLLYVSKASVMVSDEGDYKWKIVNEVSFEVPPGIEVQVKVTPKRDDKQKEISKRFALRMPSTPVMLAAVEDGNVPPPPKMAQVVVDAGVVVASKTPAQLKAEAALEAKRLAKEKAEGLAVEKAAKVAASKAKAAEAQQLARDKALEVKRLAQEKAAEALANKNASKQAALDAKAEVARQNEEKEKALRAASEASQAALAGAGTPLEAVVDSGSLAVVESVDAGLVAVAAVEPVPSVPAALPKVEPKQEEPFPWMLLGLGALGVVVALILLAARRKKEQ
jgi:hypothetical protein